MAKPRPGKKREKDAADQPPLPGTRAAPPTAPTTTRILPMQLQVHLGRNRRVGGCQPTAHDGGREVRARPRAAGRSAGGHRGTQLGFARARRGEARV